MRWRNYVTRPRLAHLGMSLTGLATLWVVALMEYGTMYSIASLRTGFEVGLLLVSLLVGGPLYVLSLLLFIGRPNRCPRFFRYFLVLYGGYAALYIGWYAVILPAYEDYKSGGLSYMVRSDDNAYFYSIALPLLFLSILFIVVILTNEVKEIVKRRRGNPNSPTPTIM